MSEHAPYYCDQCGLRYDAPGICTGTAEGPHPPANVVALVPSEEPDDEPSDEEPKAKPKGKRPGGKV